MFLLFFLMVAAGMLGLLWLYFPVQGGSPQETIPFPAPITVPAAAQPAELPPPPEVTVAAGEAGGGVDPAAATQSGAAAAAAGTNAPATAPTSAVQGPPPASAGTPAVPTAPGLPPGATSAEDIDRLLEKLLGNGPPVPPTRP
jgi:hypothetical protein